MENDVVVSELLELLWGNKPTMPKEVVAHSSIPSNVLSEFLFNKLCTVLYVQQFFTYDKWLNYFEKFCHDMLSSHEKYIRYVMFACLYEHKYSRNIFDSFISVLIVVRITSKDMHRKVGINFLGLDSDIMMVFYREVLKSSFHQNGGFHEFVEYICLHKHLEWDFEKNDLALFYDDSALLERLKKEYSCYWSPDEIDEISPSVLSALTATAQIMAGKVLQTTTVDLPILLSKHELDERIVDYRKLKLANKTQKNQVETSSTFETSEGNSSWNSNSKPDCLAAQQEGIEWHENIIQAVIRHNQSNISHHEDVNNPRLTEAEGTLEHLETSIKSLIDVLDNCNKDK